jgi:hypothetical protein
MSDMPRCEKHEHYAEDWSYNSKYTTPRVINKRRELMTMATKTLATIMLIAMLTLSATGVNALSPDTATSKRQRDDKQLERLYKRHDRKMELRASVLGVSADELRDKLKDHNFDQVIKQSGFKDRQSFHKALIGKMKEELRTRGWDDSRVQKFVEKRLSRYAKNG